jgi:hypothetical protein
MAGLGFGLTWLAIGSTIAGWWLLRKRRAVAAFFRSLKWPFLASPWVALFAMLAILPAYGMPRYALVFYPFLILPMLLMDRNGTIVRSRAWKISALFVFLIAIVILVLTPVHPLWPAVTVIRSLQARFPHSASLQRARDVYEVFTQRADVFSEVRSVIPASEKRVGLVSNVDVEGSLWRPFGTRRFIHIPSNASAEQVKDLNCIVAKRDLLEFHWKDGVEHLSRLGFKKVTTVPVRQLASAPPLDWYIFERLPAQDSPERE